LFKFRRNAENVSKVETIKIEYLLRSARRKLQMIKDPHVTGMGKFVEEDKEK